MKRNNFLVGIAIVLFVVVLVYIGVTFYFEMNSPDDTSDTTQAEQSTAVESESEPPMVQETVGYEYVGEVNEEVLLTGKDEKYLILANKVNPLGENYEPDDKIRFYKDHPYFKYFTKEEELEARTAAAVIEMMDEMYACGIRDVLVTSAYRSYTRQAELFNGYINNETDPRKGFSKDAYACLGYSYIKEQYIDKGLTVLSHADAKRVVLSYSAEPGTSEHQTGLCVDFITEDMNGNLTTVFEEKAAFAWLSENAYKFGFILRYPEDKEHITGYTYEPWHYRFVGREVATEIHFGNLTLEEYLGVAG